METWEVDVRRRAPIGREVGVDLLLTGSDAFGHLADELAAEYARRHDAGDRPEVLEWTRRMAEFAGWWCGRLEAEADHVVGFGRVPNPNISANDECRPGVQPDEPDGRSKTHDGCRRRRRRPPG
jgi:hypothetical protein